MTTSNFQPDDPRLTAYALRELDHSERAEVEALLAESAEARMALEGIRETIALLRSELTFEPTLTLTNSQRETVTQALVAVDTVEPTRGAGRIPASETRATIKTADVGKTSRWVVIVRAATTVAAVAAVAVAIPWVSRSLQDGSPNRSASDPRLASARPARDESTFRGEASKSSGSTGGGPMSESGSMDRESGAKEVATESRSQLSAATAESRPNEEVAESSVPIAAGGESRTDAVVNLQDEVDAQQMPDIGVLILKGNESDVEKTSQSIAQLEGQSGDQRMKASQGGDRVAIASAESKSDVLILSGGESTTIDGRSVVAGGGLGGGRSGVADSGEEGRREEFETRLSITRFSEQEGFRGLSKESEQAGEATDLRRFGSFGFRRSNDAAPGTEAYDAIVENAFTTPMEQPLSTFSIDVDTASYANTRRFIQQGQLPPRNAVRIEELVNYFRYDYPEPADGSPFSVNVDVATCPWNPQNKLARVGLKARTIAEDKRPATNLVFLIDVSGSMAAENKLPLVKQALGVLVSKMGEDDQIAIVTYAGEAGLKLNSTSGSQRNVIQQAIDSLSSGGSTNGAAGISIAYDTAIQSFIKGGANRVILCTDGDFNVGVSDDNTLVEIIQEKAASGVFLSVFGFGMGNLKDAKLEKLADKGNGNYGYIDGLQEARKVFGEQLSGTLITVAKDVKLQLEFSNLNGWSVPADRLRESRSGGEGLR